MNTIRKLSDLVWMGAPDNIDDTIKHHYMYAGWVYARIPGTAYHIAKAVRPENSQTWGAYVIMRDKLVPKSKTARAYTIVKRVNDPLEVTCAMLRILAGDDIPIDHPKGDF